MCSGNVAADILSALGFYVVDADKVAHAALEDVKDRVFEAFEEMAERRGLKLRDGKGSVQRRALASLVFSDPRSSPPTRPSSIPASTSF
jgi:dephospho-CoA kinase